MTDKENIWDNATRVISELTPEVGEWLKERCFEHAYIEAYKIAGGKSGILVFARSADALAFRLTFPSQ